jgi:signal transduction histidine kinase/CheY-like chemotaxis protein
VREDLTPPRHKNALLEDLLSFAQRSESWTFNLLLLAIVTVLSAGLSAVIWIVMAKFVGFPSHPGIVFWILGLGALVAIIVGTPAVLFSDALITRIQSIERDLRQALAAADMANRAKTEFLANMSHEIRTPLNGVLGMAQVLETTSLTPAQRETLRMIHDSGDLLMAIIGDILDLSRIEVGQISLDPAPQPLAGLLSGTVELFKPRAQERGTRLDWVIEGEVPEFATYDSVRVRQCIANLVSNAVKFTRDGEISVTLSAQGTAEGWRIGIEVRDSGIGIDPAAQARLFQPFEQASKATAQLYGGTGLGLAISRRLARLMGGDITLRSAPGEGATFTLSFIAGIAAPVDLREKMQNRGAGEGLHERTILVVDDSRINRMVVNGLLTPLGCRCIEAADGKIALELLERDGADLVLLDMHMPIMDGRATLAGIRALPGAKAQTPVIALTADVLSGRREDYLKMGFQGYLTKPLRRAALFSELAMIDGTRGK